MSVLAQDDKSESSHQLRYCALLITHRRDCGLEHTEPFVDLRVGGDQRHQDADHVGVRAGCDCDQAALVTILRDLLCLLCSRSFRFLRLYEFDSLHAAEATHVADDGPAALPLAGTALKALSEFVGARQ